MIRTYIKNQELADKQLDRPQLKLASPQSPISCPRVLHNRLAVHPPALLRILDFGSAHRFASPSLKFRTESMASNCAAATPAKRMGPSAKGAFSPQHRTHTLT
jgi:hypothetical protein